MADRLAAAFAFFRPGPSPAPAGRPPSSAAGLLSDLSSGLGSSPAAVYAGQTTDQIADQLNTDLNTGLALSILDQKYRAHGPNEIAADEPEPLWRRFLSQFQETLILLLLASAAVSVVVGNLDDAISITVAVVIVVSVGFVQEYRSEKSIAALSNMMPQYAHVIRSDSRAGAYAAARPAPRAGERRPRGQSVGLKIDDSEQSLVEAEASALTVPAAQLVPGDLVLFHTGDRIPADVRITHAADLTIDQSNLTGETEPVFKTPDLIALSPDGSGPGSGHGRSVDIGRLSNMAFMGTLVRGGHGSGIVVATGADTEFGRISVRLKEIESPRTPFQQSMDRLGSDLSWMSFAVIGFIVFVGLLRGWAFLDMFTIAVSLAVAAIPEGLPIIVTVTLALGVLRMSRRNAVVRRLPSVETLGCVNIVCTDKTGTLTQNHMTATNLWHFPRPSGADGPSAGDSSSRLGRSRPLTGQKSRSTRVAGNTGPDPSPADSSVFSFISVADPNRQSAGSDEAVLSAASLSAASRSIITIANIANHGRLMANHHGSSSGSSTIRDRSVQRSRWAGSPTDVALLDLVDSVGTAKAPTSFGRRQDEVPFSSDRKWAGCVVTENGQATAYAKGSLEQILSRCSHYMSADGKKTRLDPNRQTDAMGAAEAMGQQGLRVLAFASGPPAASIRDRDRPGSAEDVYQGLTFAGLVGMSDPPRPGVREAIQTLRMGGVRVVMITGDSDVTAAAIATQLGILLEPVSAATVITGDRLDQMSDDELFTVSRTACVFARTNPDHKLRIVKVFQGEVGTPAFGRTVDASDLAGADGNVVAMTGDGVNDGPALKKADIGISMGLHGTDVAKEAADMILTDDNFSTILAAIEEGKAIFYNIQNFLAFQLSTSAAALGLVLVSTLAGYANPLNATQILWINILMDGPPAQSLGVEPVDPAVMRVPPRSRHARALTGPMLMRVFQSAFVIMAGTLLVYILEMAADGAITARDTTMTFTCFVLFDMFNALTCRSESKSVLAGEVRLIGRGSNVMFNYAVAGSLVGQVLVVYFPPLQRVFQTEGLTLADWVWLITISSSVFWVDEARKWQKRLAGASAGLAGYSVNV